MLYTVALTTSMSGMEIFSAALLLALLIFFWRKGSGGNSSPIPIPPFMAPLLAFVSVALVGILSAETSAQIKLYDIGRMRFFLILYPVLFYSLFYFDPRRHWLRALIFATAVIGIYGFFQHFIPLDLVRPEGKKIYLYAIQSEEIGPLVLGTFNHHLTFSNIYYLYACLFFSLALLGGRTRKGLTALSLLLFLLCVWTQSRAAWVSVPLGMLIIVWARGRRFFLVTCGLLAAAFSILYFCDHGFHERLHRTTEARDDLYSLGPRKRLWLAQWEFFSSHRWFGVGYNNNERMAKPMVDRLYPNRTDNFYGHAHSTPLQILATTGIFGMAAYLWLWFAIFRKLWILRRSNVPVQAAIAYGLLAAFIGFHLQGLTQWNFGDAEVIHNFVFLWAVLGVAEIS